MDYKSCNQIKKSLEIIATIIIYGFIFVFIFKSLDDIIKLTIYAVILNLAFYWTQWSGNTNQFGLPDA